MEIRVHGIGGTTAESMLGLEPSASLVPLWPLGTSARPHLWQGDDAGVAAYHWAPLTSGSRWFALWPLLLPFTILNVAGYMHPPGAFGRVAKLIHGGLCYVTTVWLAAWLVLAGQVLAGDRGWSEAAGMIGAVALALALLWITGVGNHRQREGATPSRRSAIGGRGLSDPGFFTTGRLLWSSHVVAMAATFAGVYGARPSGSGGLRRQAGDVAVSGGGLIVVLLFVLAVLAAASYLTAGAGRRGPVAWAFRAVGAAGLGAAMIGGLLTALLRVLVDDQGALRGPAFVLFDVYGWAVLAAVAAGVTVAVMLLVRKSPGEMVPTVGHTLLPNPVSWARARVALLPRAAFAALGAATLTFLVVGTGQFFHRAPETVATWSRAVGIENSATPAEQAREATWHPTNTPPVRIAQLTIYGLFGFMFLNLVRSKGSPAALRRVGQVWDILTFWPRRYHPFAVRPYPVQAIPHIRALVMEPGDGGAGLWPDQLLTVVAHSQGSMLMIAALAPVGAAGTRSRIDHLVTAGCPLRALYLKAFPSYCDEGLIVDVARAVRAPSRWSNVFRFTDHVGRTVFGEETSWTPTSEPAGLGRARIWASAAPAPAGEPGARLVDCAVVDPRHRQDPIQGHNDYWADDRVREVVAGE